MLFLPRILGLAAVIINGNKPATAAPLFSHSALLETLICCI
jgi:hypothetical protein